jgi:ABC-type branched-subunit amino acid transport system substrate-binding protein
VADNESPQPTNPQPEPILQVSGDASPNEQTRLTSDSTGSPASAARSADHQSPQRWIGRTIARYRIVELLGMGAMGVVYRAFDTSIERDVAIKILPEELAADPATRGRFLAEAKAAGRLSNPHVVALYEIGQQDQTDYIVMELMNGGNLADSLKRDGAFAPAEATQIVAGVCEGLAAAHAAGMIHRDIKPSNLLRNAHGAVKLADFGLAKITSGDVQHLTLAGQLIGTPYYMSPEQCQSKTLDARSDIYSLGATYYSLLTGVAPYHEIASTVQVMFAHVHGEPLDPTKINPAVPEVCARIVSRATAKTLEARYQTAAEMHADLATAHLALGGHPAGLHHSVIQSQMTIQSQTALPAARPSSERGARRGMPLVAIIAAAVVVLGACSAWLFFRPRNPAAAALPVDGAPAAGVAAAQGVTDSTIEFGTSIANSGPNREFGRSMALGIRTGFESVNAEGGVSGRTLKLTALDDGYEPDRALANMQELFEKRKVFAIVGNVGTANAKVTVPYALAHRLLFFAPISGAAFLRHDPPDRYVFNYRASSSEETSALVHYFVKIRRIPANRIAVFAQNDSFGEEGFQGAVRALRVYGIRPEDIFRTGYERNTMQAAEAVDQVVAHRDRIQAIVMVPTYAAAAQFVKGLKDRNVNVSLASVSGGGSSLAERLRELGPQYGEGLVVSQVVPHFQSQATGVIRYRDLLHKYHPEAEASFVSLEGFIAAQCLIEGLRRTGPDLTSEKLIDALESIRDLDLGIGPIISFGPSRHQASNKVWGTVLDRNRNFENLDLE